MRYGPSSRQLFVVFDYDGVLVNTKPTVLKAYEAVGIKPSDVHWGQPWEAWLPDLVDGDVAMADRLHRMKNLRYMELLNVEGFPPTLPPAEVASWIKNDGTGHVSILTGASYAACAHIIASLGFWEPEDLLGFGLDASRKRSVVNALALAGANVVYVDDIEELGTEVVKGTIGHFVHYHGQTADELMEEVMSWTR